MGHTEKLIKQIRGLVAKSKDPSRKQTLALIDELTTCLEADNVRVMEMAMAMGDAIGEREINIRGRKKVKAEDKAFNKRARELRGGGLKAGGKSWGDVERIMKQEFPKRRVTKDIVRSAAEFRPDWSTARKLSEMKAGCPT